MLCVMIDVCESQLPTRPCPTPTATAGPFATSVSLFLFRRKWKVSKQREPRGGSSRMWLEAGGEGGGERRLETPDRFWRFVTPFVIWFDYIPRSGPAVICCPLLGASRPPGQAPLSTLGPLSLPPSQGPATLYSLASPTPDDTLHLGRGAGMLFTIKVSPTRSCWVSEWAVDPWQF